MGAVKVESSSSETDAVFRRHSQREGVFLLSEWRDAFSDLYKVAGGATPLHERSKGFHQWLDVGGSTFLETEDIIGLLKPLYSIGSEQEIRSWLERYPSSKQVLLRVPSLIGEYFQDAELRLEVRQDPETGDQDLGVYIRTALGPAEAVEQFTTFDSNWGEHLHSLTDGDLLFNIESKS
jgi:hypothetical protein